MRSPTVAKRKPRRSRVFLSAQVDSGGRTASAHIRDISRSGALLETEVPLAIGDSIGLTCGDTRLSARVAWAERGWYGLEFETPLLVRQLVDPAGALLAVSAPRTYRRADILES